MSASLRVALASLLCAVACKDTPATPPSSDIATRAAAQLGASRCEGLLPSAAVQKTLGHALRYREVRHGESRFHVLSCENETKKAAEVFAFDVGCGSGARERFVTVVRALENGIRQSDPKVGDEAWASPNVYLSWYAKTSCYTTVLLSWKRPRAQWLRDFAGELARFASSAGG